MKNKEEYLKNLMKNRDESYIGDNALKIYGMIKNLGKCTHPVGALIPSKEDHEWSKLRDRFEKYGVNMSKGGLIITVKWINTLMDATCPIAEETGIHPVEFTNNVVILFSKIVKDTNNNSWIKQSNELQKEIVKNIENDIVPSSNKIKIK